MIPMESLDQYNQKLHSFMEGVIVTDIHGKTLDRNDGLSRITANLHNAKNSRKKVMIVGNGGSAAIASHLQNDLCKAVQMRAMVFTEGPLLTALSNDICYAAAYPELVNLWTDDGDMLVAISSSGRSKNIIDAVEAARKKGCSQIVTLSGFLPDNPLRKIGDINLYVASGEYGYVELAHSVLAHYISDSAREKE
jgi:D-sedoheptulose 7-phosphate isomerase